MIEASTESRVDGGIALEMHISMPQNAPYLSCEGLSAPIFSAPISPSACEDTFEVVLVDSDLSASFDREPTAEGLLALSAFI